MTCCFSHFFKNYLAFSAAPCYNLIYRKYRKRSDYKGIDLYIHDRLRKKAHNFSSVSFNMQQEILLNSFM